MVLRKVPQRIFVILSLFVLASLPATVGVQSQNNQQYIALYRSGTSKSARAQSVQRAGAGMRFNYDIIDAAAVTVPNEHALVALQNDSDILSVLVDQPVFATQNSKGDVKENGKPGGGGTPPPPPSSEILPAGVARIGAPTATSGAGIGVAIVDTGIDFAHGDLAPAPNAAGTAFSAYNGGSCQDDAGHGTHVSGIVAAKMGNNLDVIGVAPAATLYCVKVLDSSGSGTDASVIAGLNWILNANQTLATKISVVNMSLGRSASSDDSAMKAAIDALAANNIVVVVSAGNDPKVDVSSQVPAGFSNVLAVASTTAKTGTNACRRLKNPIAQDTASSFTTDGIGVAISAPGEDQEDVNSACLATSTGILSLKLGGGTTRMLGTSMAAPHVTGVVARMIQAAGGVVNVGAIRDGIINNAYLKGKAPYDSPTTNYTFDGVREGIVRAP